MEGNYASEVEALLRELNKAAGNRASLVTDVDARFARARARFKPMLGGIDWNRALLMSASESTAGEQAMETLGRVSAQFYNFCRECQIAPDQRVVLLSDDFYSTGIECPAAQVPEVFRAWLNLPHAIFGFASDYSKCFHISFTRNTYYGRSQINDSRRE